MLIVQHLPRFCLAKERHNCLADFQKSAYLFATIGTADSTYFCRNSTIIMYHCSTNCPLESYYRRNSQIMIARRQCVLHMIMIARSQYSFLLVFIAKFGRVFLFCSFLLLTEAGRLSDTDFLQCRTGKGSRHSRRQGSRGCVSAQYFV